ncbi:hypothetical protein HHK36_005374 [Tetracentron sinense]|uniref:Alpha 1,4-glycosyltransferase domain-containing protein n=1 Tax=Tetracentron sinense TaxID=13715 RepID=A0A834ZPB9_TETSI|nr:hypothetical protein HHK36_005374 [Tetracentron sinense]
MSRQPKEKDSKAVRLAEMNRKNRAENFKNASEMKPVNTSLKAGEAGYDPFSRRWTRSMNYYVSKAGGGDETAASTNGDAAVVLAGPGGSNGPRVTAAVEAGMVATVAALEAAADAGKLVDTSAPVDQGTESNSLHNFELPISLAGLQMFGGAQGAHLGFMVRKQRIEAMIGCRVAENDGRRHALTLTVSDYKRRRVKEEIPPSKLKIHLPLLQKSDSSVLPLNISSTHTRRQLRENSPKFKILQSTALSRRFSARVKEFFSGDSSKSSCKVRFFMTWISSLDSFSYRELFTVESLFKSHPNACLLIVSNSMDSIRGTQLLRPFLDQGFRVTAISPDFDYIFKNTLAEAWFDQLRKGNIDPGEVSLGQNLSNLLRLSVLYKFGGIYLDTDVIVLKSFSKLRNAIGAQTVDLENGNWSRLNNAVMIFDKKHPLLFKFIEEFALTFNGNKWGHNGPYLVSRVVSRVSGRPGFNFTVLPPPAFYPVDWSRIRGLFLGPKDGDHSKWLLAKLGHIRNQSFAVHLWNRQSRKLKIEEGSIIRRIMLDCCVLCNSSMTAL